MDVAAEKKMVGVEIVGKSLSLEGQDVVGSIAAQHVGKIGSVKLTLEGKLEFLPLVNKGIDAIEKLIPGDQTLFANMAKEAVSKLKIKF